MTSDRTDDQILKDPSGQPSVEQNVGSIGGHDRLNEAPRLDHNEAMAAYALVHLVIIHTKAIGMQPSPIQLQLHNKLKLMCWPKVRDGLPG